MNIKTTLKATVAAAALFAIAAPVSAGTISNSNDTASVTLSGHFNKGVLWMSDGEASRVSIVDNTNSQTRGRIVVKGKLNEAVNYVALSEWAMTSGNSSSVSPSGATLAAGGAEVGADSAFTMRHTMIRMGHKSFGSVRLGHTSEANDGITEISMTGAADIVYGGATNIGNSIVLRTSTQTGTEAAGGVTAGSFFSNAGEGGRLDTIRYDTPSFGGFSGAASFQADQSSSVAVRYGAKFSGLAVSAGYGASFEGAAGNSADMMHGGSVAVGHDSGLNARVSGGVVDSKVSNADHAWQLSFGAGYKANLISAGKTNFAIDWTRSQNAASDADTADLWSIGFVQETDAGVKFYLGYQIFQAERGGHIDYDDASTVMAGTKVFF